MHGRGWYITQTKYPVIGITWNKGIDRMACTVSISFSRMDPNHTLKISINNLRITGWSQLVTVDHSFLVIELPNGILLLLISTSSPC